MELFIEPRAVAPAVGSPSAGGRRSLRVLVVDDNAQAAQVLAMILKCWGHESRVTHDGPSGLRAARDDRPDVILLDIGLPGMDGYAVARALRQEPAFDDTILLAMSGLNRDEDRRAAIDAGCERHLVKPIDLDALERLLARLPVAARPPAV